MQLKDHWCYQKRMLNALADSSVRIGLRMNLDKTKVMFNDHFLPVP
jgi:hypothetical protein